MKGKLEIVLPPIYVIKPYGSCRLRISSKFKKSSCDMSFAPLTINKRKEHMKEFAGAGVGFMMDVDLFQSRMFGLIEDNGFKDFLVMTFFHSLSPSISHVSHKLQFLCFQTSPLSKNLVFNQLNWESCGLSQIQKT